MKKLIIGISGASGVIYGIRLLEILSKKPVETHLIITDTAKAIIRLETNYPIEEVEALANCLYAVNDMDAPISSGSFRTEGMIIIPCSIKSLSALANSYNVNLLIRAGDVTLKEKRNLIVVVRETPLHKGHLELMLKLAGLGATILPPMPSFYHKPHTVDEIINQTVGKILDFIGIENELYRRYSPV